MERACCRVAAEVTSGVHWLAAQTLQSLLAPSRGATTGWFNATVALINNTAVRLSVAGVNDAAVATAFGQGAFPVTVLFSGPLPVAPWNETI